MILVDENFNGNFNKDVYVALGSFDGLHKGHLTLINKVVELSKKNDGLSMVYTFKNHPLEIIDESKAPKVIMDNDEKLNILEKEGIDISCLVKFDKKFMLIEPEEFIREIIEKFNVKAIVVGFNYKFGFKNKGDVNLLRDLSEKLNFDLYVMSALEDEGVVISSTFIRGLIKDGEINRATELLTRPYSIKGEVIHGKQLGRTIGFPTANLNITANTVLPAMGVYYTNVELDGEIYRGITSVGNNPTVNGKTITVETNILDFSGDIYGKEIRVYFIERMRGNVKFNSLDELKNQLKSDKNFAEQRKFKIIL
ncbi:bifunctional riboflavin kinase/FAD synthetase [Clostridium massiliamazoniense]|uniref:bifunctional riboflavin kinase/FAD synthetase n=1 Tax=Clostridium massiliamazoniense TaxID=1347366 RepID=UPI0006D7F4FB|nr:bifunctional riboflavin kinase/FAD synthetase [Clostridium massiliamazoniense]